MFLEKFFSSLSHLQKYSSVKIKPDYITIRFLDVPKVARCAISLITKFVADLRANLLFRSKIKMMKFDSEAKMRKREARVSRENLNETNTSVRSVLSVTGP